MSLHHIKGQLESNQSILKSLGFGGDFPVNPTNNSVNMAGVLCVLGQIHINLIKVVDHLIETEAKKKWWKR